MQFQLYTKKQQRELPAIPLNKRMHDPSLYIPSDGLVNAVNVALALGQPLLITGEPGTGKTRLADHIAWIFKLDKPLVFNAQTSSTVRDLFYRYDALGHFQFSQTKQELLSDEQVEERFIDYQGLGKAIQEDRQFVVLIDEIDKAPRDLPNDILAALEDLTFKVPEVGKNYSANPENRPIIIMTSNSEKNLPDAFLRRVTYYHIPFPDAEALLEILQAKAEGMETANLKAIIQHFRMIRGKKRINLKKNPATAELIYWTFLLQKLGFDTSKLDNLANLNDAERKTLATSYSVLAKTKEDLEALQNLAMGLRKRRES